MSVLQIQRQYGYYSDKMRAYKIFIDNTLVGKICEGETLTFDCSAGKHLVRFGIDWCSSKTIEVIFGSEELLAIVECWPTSNMFNSLWKITFGRKGYIGAKLIELNKDVF